MANVLFTHSYFYKFDPKQWKNKQFFPPLGTITAASYIREKGFLVDFFDTNLADSPLDILPKFDNITPDYLVIYDDGFNYLTKMCLTLMREAAFELIKIGKEKGCKVIVSSSDSTDQFEMYMNKGADVILLGEGEASLLDTLNAYEKQEELNDIAGIVFRKGDRIINTQRRKAIEDLDSIPMAAWDLVDMQIYKDSWMKYHGYFSLNLATTRGCPYACSWCAKPIYGQKYNSRSAENVVTEIEFLIKTYGVSYFWICDDIFGLKTGWVNQFRDLIKIKELQFKYMMQSRVDVMLKDDAIKALADSGLDIVWVGAESGSQKILDAMNKDIKVEKIYEARKKLANHGVRVAFFLQFGYLGENWEDIQKTQKMLFDLMPDDMGISVSYPLPGTKFHELVKKDLVDKANWTDSDELALMFKNTFSPNFYKVLHRYIHKKFRRKQGVKRIGEFIKSPTKNHKGILRTVLALLYHTPMAILYKMLLVMEKSKN